MVKQHFAEIYNPKRVLYNDFDDTFKQLLKEAEARAEEMKKLKQQNKLTELPINGQEQTSAKNTRSQRKEGASSVKSDSKGSEDDDDAHSRILKSGSAPFANGRANVHKTIHSNNKTSQNGSTQNSTEVAFDVNKLQKMRSKASKKSEKTKISKEDQGKKKPKKNRVWDDAPQNSKLDFTDPVEEKGDDVIAMSNEGKSKMDIEGDEYSESENEEESQGKPDSAPKKKGWLSSVFQSVSGNKILEKSDLEPALKALKDRLMTKNVAEEIAEKLCESVAMSLVGKKLGSFTRVSTTVQVAMEEALIRILTPKRSIDILRDVHAAKDQGKPYVIVFVGVNGVGKSTNLAKVAYWLLQHNLSVMMAACDTFRSGAVEQLRTHARRLQIPIFEKGYERDPAVVAKEAIQEAFRNKSDVVLVDTAGRMQDNEPLMRALSKLINLNNPDLVLFVGEALVGNDAVDQLSKFNQKLADLSTSSNARLIDGILLTKFDTIDDKVGAALSMVYISGAPVMFVGCGQSYTDLKKLNVKSIVKTLLK
eukprot:TRINITY_DN10679_c0_g2_i1.p1 TRINITY_DN10679_c0_g2~~TRINITY_DN10679_c0_g2_i1.p1  ORF type:complete len:586 (-),score=177.50 TRINITY_DN10679_c0_g2_i1:209-1813(-)